MNRADISDGMAAQFGGLSGVAFDDRSVHYNSGRLVQLQSDILRGIELVQHRNNDYLPIQMIWNEKAQQGPANFTENDAAQAITNADFSRSVYVNISAKEGQTKQAFTYYNLGANFGNITICVVGHTHLNEGVFSLPGHCYIPGWNTDVQYSPSATQAAIICNLPVGGTFPGNARYPR